MKPVSSKPASSPQRYAVFRTALGVCGLAWQDETVTAVRLPDARHELTGQTLARLTGGSEDTPSGHIRDAMDAITALLDGEKTDLRFISCDRSRVDPFAQRVYDLTRAIDVGETRTYGHIAQALGDKTQSRRVGQCLGRNPFPIIVPCHRVMGANGKLTGFSAPGGTTTKLKMLEIEGAHIGEPAGLFDALPLAVKPLR